MLGSYCTGADLELGDFGVIYMLPTKVLSYGIILQPCVSIYFSFDTYVCCTAVVLIAVELLSKVAAEVNNLALKLRCCCKVGKLC